MSNPVRVVVTGQIVGTGPVVPYSHHDGLQFYRLGGSEDRRRPVIYTVPIYAVRIVSGSIYAAVRFGLRNKGQHTTPQARPCDSGLAESRVCYPGWLPHYSPHSFRGDARRGAWQLLPGKGFLIHEGADRRLGFVGGSIGCVEILDGRWNDFLAEIERLGSGTCEQIAARRGLTVTIEFARYPNAVLRD